MKIIQIPPGLSPFSKEVANAANNVVISLSKEFAKQGHEVYILGYGDLETENENVHFVPIKIPKVLHHFPLLRVGYFSLFSSKLLKRFVKAEKPDIVHFNHGRGPAAIGSRVLKKFGIPIVYTNGNPNIGFTQELWDFNLIELALKLNVSNLPPFNSVLSFLFEYYSFKNVDKIIAVSKQLKSNIRYYFGIDASKISYIPNGVDTSYFRPNLDVANLKQHHKLEDEKILLCLARISPYKNQLTIIQALPEILKEDADVKVLLVGPISDRSYFEAIQYELSKNNLKDHVIFTGAVDRNLLPKYYSLADVFILPSLSEGMPLVLLEALSSGNAIIASDIPQNKEVAVTGKEAIFINPKNSRELAENVVMLLEDNKLREKMRKQARKTAVKYFDWKVISEKTIELYEKLLEG